MLGLLGLFRILSRGAKSFVSDERSRAVALLALALIGTGGIFYRQVEDLTWIDSFYLATISLTTVGYGDFVPQTTEGKVFTMIYVLVGIGVLVAFITEVARHVIGADDRDADASG